MSYRYQVTAIDERRDLWQKIFDSDTVYVLSDIPEFVEFKGYGPQLCFWLDLAALLPQQRAALTTYLATAYNIDPREVPDLLAVHGLPIKALGTMVFTLRELIHE